MTQLRVSPKKLGILIYLVNHYIFKGKKIDTNLVHHVIELID